MPTKAEMFPWENDARAAKTALSKRQYATGLPLADSAVKACEAELKQQLSTDLNATGEELTIKDRQELTRLRGLRDELACGQAGAIDALCKELEDEDWSMREAALLRLPQVAHKGHAKALAIAVNSLTDSFGGVRTAALDVLKQLVQPGDEQAVAELTKLLSHPKWRVRATVVQALGFAAEPGSSAVQTISCMLEDHDPGVRKAAVCALQQASGEDMGVMKVLAVRTQDSHWSVRQASVKAVEQMSPKGNRTTLNLMAGLMDDHSAAVREAAVVATASISASEDAAASTEHLAARINDSDGAVRAAAVTALVDVAGRSCQKSLAKASEREADEDARVRRAAAKVQLMAQVEDIEARNVFDQWRETAGSLGNQVPAATIKYSSRGPLPWEEDARAAEVALGKRHYAEGLVLAASAVETCQTQFGIALNGDGTSVAAFAGSLSVWQRQELRRLHALLAELQTGQSAALNALSSKIKDAEWHEIEQAMRELPRIAHKGLMRAVKIAIARLEDGHSTVRTAALWALSHIATKGDAETLVEISKHLKNPQWRVRATAVEALGSVASADDVGAEALVAGLEDLDAHVRKASVQALEKVSGKDQNVAVAMALRAKDDDWTVRCVAASGIAGTAKQDDEAALESLAALLKDPIAPVREAASTAIARLVSKGNSAALEMMMLQTKDSDAAVRRAAVSALAQIASKGDTSAFAAATSLLKDQDAGTRQCAAVALQEIAAEVIPQSEVVPAEDPEEDHALMELLQEDDGSGWRVNNVNDGPNLDPWRLSSDEEEKQRSEDLAEAMPRLQHKDAEVRICAVSALSHIAHAGDEAIIDLIKERLQDSSHEVRLAALEALQQLAPGGHQAALSAVATQLVTDSELKVCQGAHLAVERIANEATRGPEGNPLP